VTFVWFVLAVWHVASRGLFLLSQLGGARIVLTKDNEFVQAGDALNFLYYLPLVLETCTFVVIVLLFLVSLFELLFKSLRSTLS